MDQAIREIGLLTEHQILRVNEGGNLFLLVWDAQYMDKANIYFELTDEWNTGFTLDPVWHQFWLNGDYSLARAIGTVDSSQSRQARDNATKWAIVRSMGFPELSGVLFAYLSGDIGLQVDLEGLYGSALQILYDPRLEYGMDQAEVDSIVGVVPVEVPTPSPTSAPPAVTPAPPAATPTPTMTPISVPTPTNTPEPAGDCDPSYPTVCIPPPPPDLNCGDISFRRFPVRPPDPHGFDGDNDGVGCES